MLPGSRVGPYEVVSLLGSGGMGSVYRARDPRLGRDVAIKMLPPEYAADPVLRARFEQEARAASALVHPGIMTVHEIGSDEGLLYLVAELIEGRTLRDQLRDGPLPQRKAIDLAAQIAEALAVAHRNGIVHRDLKPENIMVTPDGRAKILDFGIAKRTAPALDPSDATRHAGAAKTDPGMILGTVGYMSPEQVKAESVDARSDLFSLGVVFYEMLTGRRAFERGSTVETLSAILKDEPAPLPAGVTLPPWIARILDRCLEKERTARFQSASDLAFALRAQGSETTAAAEAPPAQSMRSKRAWLALPAAVAGLLCGALLWLRPPAPAPQVGYRPWATEAESEDVPTFSPDGKMLAYVLQAAPGRVQILVRPLDSPVPVAVTEVNGGRVNRLQWSSDASKLYFRRRDQLMEVSITGGSPRAVLDLPPGTPAGGFPEISPDGRTVVANCGSDPQVPVARGVCVTQMGGDSKWTPLATPFPSDARVIYRRFSADGSQLLLIVIAADAEVSGTAHYWILPAPGRSGTPRQLPPNMTTAWRNLVWMPDGRRMVVGARLPDSTADHLRIVDSQTGRGVTITAGLSSFLNPSVSPAGDRIAATQVIRDDDVVEVAIDGSRMTPLLATARSEWSASWLPSGEEIVYLTNARGPTQIWTRNLRQRSARPLLTETSAGGPWQFTAFALSASGESLAFESSTREHAIQVWRIGTGQPVRLNPSDTDHHAPVWSPLGDAIAYLRMVPRGLLVSPVAGGAPQQLHPAAGPEDWSADNRWILASDERRYFLLSPDGKQTRPLPARGAYVAAAFSPDGRSVYAYLQEPSTRRWLLDRFDVDTAMLRETVTLPVPDQGTLSTLRFHPDGKRFLATLSKTSRDIVILENLPPAPQWYERLFDFLPGR